MIFSGSVEYGDLYYDLSKMYGGIILNYDLIKNNLMNYNELKTEIFFDFHTRYQNKLYLKSYERFIPLKKI